MIHQLSFIRIHKVIDPLIHRQISTFAHASIHPPTLFDLGVVVCLGVGMGRVDANVLPGPRAHAPIFLLRRTVGRVPHQLIDGAVGSFHGCFQGHCRVDDAANVPHTHFESE